MLDEKVMDDFPHDIGLITAGLVDQNPNATLESPIQVFGHEQLQLRQLRELVILSLVPTIHHGS